MAKRRQRPPARNTGLLDGNVNPTLHPILGRIRPSHRVVLFLKELPEFGRKSTFVTGLVTLCDGFCDGLTFCKSFSANKCDGVTAQNPWKAHRPWQNQICAPGVQVWRYKMAVHIITADNAKSGSLAV
jgi:hypothetical protein